MLFASTGAASSGNGGNFLIPNGTFVVELVIFLVVLGVDREMDPPATKGSLRDATGPHRRCVAEGGGGTRREPESACRARPGAGRGARASS